MFKVAEADQTWPTENGPTIVRQVTAARASTTGLLMYPSVVFQAKS